MSENEQYQFEVGEEGADHELLDEAFNKTTKEFISNNGLKSGMKILDAGCGTGVMTEWLAEKVGTEGKILAVDNNEYNVKATMRRAEKKKLSNIEGKVLSVYDIETLNEKFDIIYCRFLLHHLHYPRKTIKLFHAALNTNGIYIGEEGIVSAAFAYPPSFAWQGFEPNVQRPENEHDGVDRDGNFGMKLFYYSKQVGFDIIACNLVQPVFWLEKQKLRLLGEQKAFKKTNLEQGGSEEAWQQRYNELQKMAVDNDQMIAFYQSFQVAGRKS